MINYRHAICAILALVATMIMFAQDRRIKVTTSEGSVITHNVRDIESIEFIHLMNPITNVRVSLNNRSATISWDNIDGALEYEVYHSTDGKEFKILGTTNTTSYTHEWVPIGKNHYAVRAIGEYAPNELSISDDVVTVNGTKVESGLYMGLVAFSNSANGYTIRLLNSSTSTTFKNYINSLKADKNSTALYYGVDRGIDLIRQGNLPDDLIDVSIITFTDGLDNWSMMLDYNYETEEAYVDMLKGRILNDHYFGMNLNSYAIGLLGTDIDKENSPLQYQLFKKQLTDLSSTPENAYEAENMADVNQIFQEIASKLVAVNTFQTVTALIPGQSDGTHIRFTFDDVNDAANSHCYIEGVYNHQHHCLDNPKCEGMTMPKTSVINGVIENNIFVRFNFSGLQSKSNSEINTKNIKQWASTADTGQWQINSEFTPDDDTTVNVQKKSAVVVLVLDCTSSIGSTKFKELQDHAISFINTLIGK